MEYRHRTTTLTSSLSFVSISTHHRPSNDGTLVSPPPPPPPSVGGSSLGTSSPFAGVGGGGGGGGGALDHNIGLNLNTYTAGEDAGRLATMAREFGLANARPPRRQLRRKHAFQAFLRNHPNDDWDEREDIPQSRSLDDPPPPPPPRPSPETTSSLSSSSATETYPVPAAAASDASTEAETRKRKQQQQRHPPLRFVFSGYSLWLELAQYDVDEDGRGDLDRAMIDAADRFDLGGAIPSPHVTALYGIEYCAHDAAGGEEEVRRAFREEVPRGLAEEAERRRRSSSSRRRRMDAGVGEDEGEDSEEQDEDDEKLWPDLDATGMIVDVEFDGVDQGTMDMAWAEVSFATSPAHETLIDALHRIFCRRPPTAAPTLTSPSSFEEEKKEEHRSPRLGPWVPHLSLCYDNPEGLGPNLTRAGVEELVREQCPTLSSVLDGGDGVKFTRAVSGISLWRTAGTMAEWKCLDRFEFPTVG